VSAARVRVRHFTDPGCPWAFSAERQRLRLQWLFGDQLEWELRMVVLSTERDANGFDGARQSGALRKIQARFGMPIDWAPRPYAAPTVHACRAVVAVRMGWPEHTDAFLRRLRVLGMGGALLDDSDSFELAAEQAGLPVRELAAYAAREDVAAALEEDARAARRPTAAARAQEDRLAGEGDDARYTCPSYVLHRPQDGTELDLPGFQPLESYEAGLANLVPDLERRDDPEDVAEVLAWAPYPLATVEVAAVCARDAAEVRSELGRAGARFEPVGGDGYWSAA
jgi:2-hydroxychromene-2-carboxylate isomerase